MSTYLKIVAASSMALNMVAGLSIKFDSSAEDQSGFSRRIADVGLVEDKFDAEGTTKKIIKAVMAELKVIQDYDQNISKFVDQCLAIIKQNHDAAQSRKGIGGMAGRYNNKWVKLSKLMNAAIDDARFALSLCPLSVDKVIKKMDFRGFRPRFFFSFPNCPNFRPRFFFSFPIVPWFKKSRNFLSLVTKADVVSFLDVDRVPALKETRDAVVLVLTELEPFTPDLHFKAKSLAQSLVTAAWTKPDSKWRKLKELVSNAADRELPAARLEEKLNQITSGQTTNSQCPTTGKEWSKNLRTGIAQRNLKTYLKKNWNKFVRSADQDIFCCID